MFSSKLDNLVKTEVYPAQTPWSLAPISAPHDPAVWLRTHAWVLLTWSISNIVVLKIDLLENHLM